MSDSFTYAVIGKAMEVHRALGPGVDEIFYHELLSERLRTAGIEHLVRPRETLIHRGIVADVFEADLVFPGRLVGELKCLRGGFDPEHFLQIICYQKYWRVPTGLLFDFAKESLAHRRVNYDPVPINGFDSQSLLVDAPDLGSDLNLARALCHAIAQVLITHGLGYRDTTYRGLLAAEFQAEGFGCVTQPTATVRLDARPLGSTRCDCLVTGGRFAVQVLALRRSINAADIAILRTHLRLLGLPHGLILNFAKTGLEHCWIRRTPIEAQRLEADKDEGAEIKPAVSPQSLPAPNLGENPEPTPIEAQRLEADKDEGAEIKPAVSPQSLPAPNLWGNSERTPIGVKRSEADKDKSGEPKPPVSSPSSSVPNLWANPER